MNGAPGGRSKTRHRQRARARGALDHRHREVADAVAADRDAGVGHRAEVRRARRELAAELRLGVLEAGARDRVAVGARSRQAIAMSLRSVRRPRACVGVDAVEPSRAARGLEVVVVEPASRAPARRARPARRRSRRPRAAHVDARLVGGVRRRWPPAPRTASRPAAARTCAGRRRRPAGRRPRRTSRRPRCRCPASRTDRRRAASGLRERRQVQAGDAAAPDARRRRPAIVAPGRDGVALGRDGDLRPQRAGAGLARGSTSSGGGDRRPCGVLQSRGDDVAGLLPDRVRGAVDAEVDVQRARARPADRDRAAEAAGRGAARRDGGVDVAVGDPDDRDPVAVADRDLDLGAPPPSADRRAPAARQTPP